MTLWGKMQEDLGTLECFPAALIIVEMAPLLPPSLVLLTASARRASTLCQHTSCDLPVFEGLCSEGHWCVGLVPSDLDWVEVAEQGH